MAADDPFYGHDGYWCESGEGWEECWYGEYEYDEYDKDGEYGEYGHGEYDKDGEYGEYGHGEYDKDGEYGESRMHDDDSNNP